MPVTLSIHYNSVRIWARRVFAFIFWVYSLEPVYLVFTLTIHRSEKSDAWGWNMSSWSSTQGIGQGPRVHQNISKCQTAHLASDELKSLFTKKISAWTIFWEGLETVPRHPLHNIHHHNCQFLFKIWSKISEPRWSNCLIGYICLGTRLPPLSSVYDACFMYFIHINVYN